MSTYLEIQQRVRDDYLNRADYTSEVQRAIKASVRFFERRRWRFNETATSVATVANSASIALPSNFLVLDYLEINLSGTNLPLDRRSLDYILQMRASSAVGAPTDYTLYGSKIELAVIPDSAYSCPLHYIKSLTELSADTDTNAWTQGGMQDVIAYHAAQLMWGTVIRNDKEAVKYQLLEHQALKVVESELEQYQPTRLNHTEF